MSNKETTKEIVFNSDDTKFLKSKDLMTSAREILAQAKESQAQQPPKNTQSPKK